MISAVQYPIVYVILKRMRAPLILLIMAYSIATAGLAIIPGVDADGNTVHLTIFQSFYFISYVATTIGFGEIPYEFTDVQRLWVVFCIYLTVISWFVAIGNIISLLQDPALNAARKRQNFVKQTKNISKKFYVICGYGETGEMLQQHLYERGLQCVIIDNDPERINVLELNSSSYNTPFLLGDAGDVETLKMAGIENEHCRAVLAVTNSDNINVKTSVTVKLLRNNLKVICRANSKEATANAKSFDTDHVISASRIYAENFSRAFRTPSIYQVTMSLLRNPGKQYVPTFSPPKGHWIICGYSEIGKEMAQFLEFEGMDYSILSNDESIQVPHIKGKGTEAVTLRAANIEEAVGIIAATESDTDNFSIIMTARQLKPSLFFVAKQNHERNNLIFENAEIDSVMESSRLTVWNILPLIIEPHLARFLRLARHQNEEWGKEIFEKLQLMCESVPATYIIKADDQKSPALLNHLESGNIIRLQDLYPVDNDEKKPTFVPLMLIKDGKEELLPKASMAITKGDIFLIASSEKVFRVMKRTIQNEQLFHYMIHGEEKPVSIVMHMGRKYLEERKTRKRQQKQEAIRVQKELKLIEKQLQKTSTTDDTTNNSGNDNV